jgi:hypothetical protein
VSKPIDEIWDELDDEERATVSPLTRIRLGLPADPNWAEKERR